MARVLVQRVTFYGTMVHRFINEWALGAPRRSRLITRPRATDFIKVYGLRPIDYGGLRPYMPGDN